LKQLIIELLDEKSAAVAQCDKLCSQNNSLKDDLAAAQTQLFNLEADGVALLALEPAARSEIQQLKDSLDQVTSASSV